MNEIKKYAPQGALAMLGVAASELVTKDRSTIWKVAGGAAGAALALYVGHRFGILKG